MAEVRFLGDIFVADVGFLGDIFVADVGFFVAEVGFVGQKRALKAPIERTFRAHLKPCMHNGGEDWGLSNLAESPSPSLPNRTALFVFLLE